ncbi:MAG: DUF4115 domain-containing protein [Candidatus Omnitrophica bacterium]|jgi:cytoskeletal protein RodZ|nr:DUF4115 domain-containing protein [Candidatus Omnitrophota bacterium]
MDRAGERLKKIRLDKGFSIEEVAKKTKVALNILKAIEEDGFINLEPIYVKGFIKIYCNFLGVPASDFISEMKEPQVTMKLSDTEEKATAYLKPMPVRKPFPWQKILIVLAAAGVLFLIAGLWRGLSKTAKVRQMSAPQKAQAVNKKKPQPKLVEAPRKIAAPKPVAVKPVLPQPVSVTRNVAISSGRDEQSGIRLGIHANEDCWVGVKIDGKTVFQSVLFKGRMESWTARDRIDLSLGSAGSVELEVNGSRIPSLGRKGQVLKNIVISKDGLKVGK